MVYRLFLFLVGLGALMAAVMQLAEGSTRMGLFFGAVGVVAMLVVWRPKGAAKRRRSQGGSRGGKRGGSQTISLPPELEESSVGGLLASVNRSSSMSHLPRPPKLADYVAAGVDPGKCSLCPKKVPANPREWRFAGFDGRPAVVCPSCWNRRFVNPGGDESDAFYNRFTTRWSFEKP
jgi:hypothetical protein